MMNQNAAMTFALVLTASGFSGAGRRWVALPSGLAPAEVLLVLLQSAAIVAGVFEDTRPSFLSVIIMSFFSGVPKTLQDIEEEKKSIDNLSLG